MTEAVLSLPNLIGQSRKKNWIIRSSRIMTTIGTEFDMNDLLKIFKALSDETRIRILKLLEEGELCVCDIVASLDMIQPKVSFHLCVLKEAGLLKGRNHFSES